MYTQNEDIYKRVQFYAFIGTLAAQCVALGLLMSDQGISVFLKLPLIVIDMGFALLCLTRGGCLRAKSMLNVKPGSLGNLFLYGISTALMIFRTLIFHERNDCMIDDCDTWLETNIVALSASLLLWMFVDYEPPKHHKKHHKHHKHHKHDKKHKKHKKPPKVPEVPEVPKVVKPPGKPPGNPNLRRRAGRMVFAPIPPQNKEPPPLKLRLV